MKDIKGYAAAHGVGPQPPMSDFGIYSGDEDIPLDLLEQAVGSDADRRDVGYEILQELPALMLRPLFLERRQLGLNRYGRGIDPSDMTPEDWYQMALRELADAGVYLKAGGLDARSAAVLRYIAGLVEAHGPVLPEPQPVVPLHDLLVRCEKACSDPADCYMVSLRDVIQALRAAGVK